MAVLTRSMVKKHEAYMNLIIKRMNREFKVYQETRDRNKKFAKYLAIMIIIFITLIFSIGIIHK